MQNKTAPGGGFSEILCPAYEAFAAFGTGDVNLSLAARHTQRILAGGAFKKLMRIPALMLIALPFGPADAAAKNTHKLLIFLIASLRVARKNTQKSKHDEQKHKYLHNAAANENVDSADGYGKPHNDQRKLVHPVAPVHQSAKPVHVSIYLPVLNIVIF